MHAPMQLLCFSCSTHAQKKSDKGFQDGIIALKPDHATLLDTAGKVGDTRITHMSCCAAGNSSRTAGSWCML